MTPRLFWLAASFLYLGLAGLIVDAWIEAALRSVGVGWRVAASAIPGIIIVLFSIFIVFRSAPLGFMVFTHDSPYPSGTTLA